MNFTPQTSVEHIAVCLSLRSQVSIDDCLHIFIEP